MNRRRLLAAASATLAGATFSFFPGVGALGDLRSPTHAKSIAAWRARIQTILARGKLPIIDTEATYSFQIDINFILQAMDEHDVAQVAFAPIFQEGRGGILSLELHRRYPAHFIPTTSDGVTWHWFNQGQSFMDTAIAEIRSGEYFFMGEFELRHYPSHLQWKAGRMDRDIAIPLDSPAVQAPFRFSAEIGTAFQVHYEIEDVLLPPFEALLARYPGARVIWCHLGQVRYSNRSSIYGAQYVRKLIARFPNLHFDLGLPGPGHVYPGSGERDATIYAFANGFPPYNGYLRGEWRDIINDHPDRFLAASDIDAGRFLQFPSSIARLRRLILDEISAKARPLVAYQNAWRLIVREPWAG